MDCKPKYPTPSSINGLVCPPNTSTSFLRFINKSLGIQLGSNVLGSMDLNSFYMSIDTYTQSSIILDYDSKPVRINPPRINLGERREMVRLSLDNEINTWNISQANFSIKLPNSVPEELFSIDMFPIPPGSPVQPLNTTYIINSIYNWLTDAKNLLFSTVLNKNIEVKRDDDELTFEFLVLGETVNYTLDITYIENGSPISQPETITIRPDIIRGHIRYPNGAYKSIFILSTYQDLNNNFIEWVWDEDVRKVEGDLDSQELGWRKMGPLFALSGANDMTCDDKNMIEPIWVRNKYNCKTFLNILVTS